MSVSRITPGWFLGNLVEMGERCVTSIHFSNQFILGVKVWGLSGAQCVWMSVGACRLLDKEGRTKLPNKPAGS